MTNLNVTTTVAPLAGDKSPDQADELTLSLDRAAGLSRTLAAIAPNDLGTVDPADLSATLNALADLVGEARDSWQMIEGKN